MKAQITIFLTFVALIMQAQLATAKMDNLNYAMGYRLGTSLKHGSFPWHQNSFVQGLQAGYNGTKPTITLAEMQAAVTQFQQANQAKLQLLGKENLLKGQAFLKKNKALPGVKTLPSGLQYKIIKAGIGNKPAASAVVTVDYEGKLLDGTIFDSSYKRGKPAQFKLGQVIPGWTQGLQLMKEGAIWTLYIPSELAYGQRGAGPIPPNSVLIFKVHLIKIK